MDAVTEVVGRRRGSRLRGPSFARHPDYMHGPYRLGTVRSGLWAARGGRNWNEGIWTVPPEVQNWPSATTASPALRSAHGGNHRSAVAQRLDGSDHLLDGHLRVVVADNGLALLIADINSGRAGEACKHLARSEHAPPQVIPSMCNFTVRSSRATARISLAAP